ncbi:MAG: hypothetical protein PHG48_07085, partial [Eubacteriales bacterium]|nr:hypothetical protein [Eubacteriales bacterium]
KSFGSWNIIDVFNTAAENREARIDISADLHLDVENGERYLLYDFWASEVICTTSEEFSLSLPPFGSKVVSVHRLTDIPQIISTSRHITQGAYDLHEAEWDGSENVLSGSSDMAGGDMYKIVIYVPEGFRYGEAAAWAESNNTACACSAGSSAGNNITRSVASTAVGNSAGSSVGKGSGNICNVEFMPAETGRFNWYVRFLPIPDTFHKTS